MSLENSAWGAVGGAISGITVAILHAMGLKERIVRLEKEQLTKEAFKLFNDGLNQRLTIIENLLEKIYNGRTS